MRWNHGRGNLTATILHAPSIPDAAGGKTSCSTVRCGTPVVAFRVGGIPDVVRDNETGYLARVRDVEDLSDGLRKVLVAQRIQADIANECRRTIEVGYTSELELQHFTSLYEEIGREERGSRNARE